MLGLFALALLLRLGALAAATDARLVLDERLYLARGEALLDGQGFVGSWQSWVRHPGSPMMAELPQYPGAYQPPGYVTFVAGAMAIAGRSATAVQLAQILLSALTVLLIYGVARDWFDERRAIIAAAICIVYPNFIAFSHYLWSETLFLFLFTAALRLVSRSRDRPPSVTAAACVGAILGLAALTRGVALFFVPVVGLWLLLSHRSRLRDAAISAVVIAAAACAVVTPWSVRSSLQHGGFVLLDTNGPFNLWRGNAAGAYTNRDRGAHYAPPFSSLPLMPVAQHHPRRLVDTVRAELGDDLPSDLEVARTARRLARKAIASDPAGFVARMPAKFVDTWNPTSFLLRHFRLGAYGDVPPAVEQLVGWVAMLAYVAVVGLALYGGRLARRDPRAWLVLLLAAYITAVHLTTFGLTRFRLPVMPFAVVLAAHALATMLDRRKES